MALQLNTRDGDMCGKQAGRQAKVILYHFLRLSTVLSDLIIFILIYQNLVINLDHPSYPESKAELQAYRKPNSSIIIQMTLLTVLM